MALTGVAVVGKSNVAVLQHQAKLVRHLQRLSAAHACGAVLVHFARIVAIDEDIFVVAQRQQVRRTLFFAVEQSVPSLLVVDLDNLLVVLLLVNAVVRDNPAISQNLVSGVKYRFGAAHFFGIPREIVVRRLLARAFADDKRPGLGFFAAIRSNRLCVWLDLKTNII